MTSKGRVSLVVTVRPVPQVMGQFAQGEQVGVLARGEGAWVCTEGELTRNKVLARLIKIDPNLAHEIRNAVIEKAKGM